VKILEGDPLRWEPVGGDGLAVTIGVFDGVHRGHQEVLDDLASHELRRAVLTFDQHPRAIVDPNHTPSLLSTMSQRKEWLGAAGVDILGILSFSAVRTMSPETFVEHVLVEVLGAQLVAIGMDFRYGAGRAGDVDSLAAMGDSYGFDVDAVPLLTRSETPISSSRIRDVIGEGDVRKAAELLSRPFTMRGSVVPGDGRGKGIGIPTANLTHAPSMALPRLGVYACHVIHRGSTYAAVSNVGVRPTFHGQAVTVEAHLLDADLDLYGDSIDVAFIERIRDEEKFDGFEELVAQIHADIASARRILS
jgi:riboflavin kinase/FMN adenylyltransferase